MGIYTVHYQNQADLALVMVYTQLKLKMKKSILILSALFLVFACDKDEKESAPSKTELLTGGSQKSWYIYASTPEDPCGSASDDTWTFFADGSVAYDHGTVTEDQEGQCGDLINFEGTWAFSAEETEITIVALRAAGSTEAMDPFTIGSGAITTLTTDRLVITTDGNSETIEFRKR